MDYKKEAMGKIGNFSFYMNKNDYQSISKKIEANFNSYKPIDGQETLNTNGGYTQTVDLQGVLVVEPLDSLTTLENYCKDRKALRFTTLNHDLDVVITFLNITQKNFVTNGNYTVQEYSLSLKEVYDEA